MKIAPFARKLGKVAKRFKPRTASKVLRRPFPKGADTSEWLG